MANTYTELCYHCIWSTKRREPAIGQKIEQNIWRIIAATGARHELHVIRVGGIENHVHALIEIPKTISVSEAMKQLKGGSSSAINNDGIAGPARFAWQDGYAAYTVSPSKKADVEAYIAQQREHHRSLTFEQEFVLFLERHGVQYESQYLWD